MPRRQNFCVISLRSIVAAPIGSTMELEHVCKRSDSLLSDTDTLAGDDLRTQFPVIFNPTSVEKFDSNRYSRGRYVKNVTVEYSVPPFSRSFPRSPIASWTPHRHPEGALYFMHQQNRIFTDAYLYDDVVLAKINACVSHINHRLEDKGYLDPDIDEIDIVLDLIEERAESIQCGYYLVDHSMRTIFWMDAFEMSGLSSWKRIPGIISASHINLILEHAYWHHCDLFPAAKLPTPAIVSELRDAIIYSAADALTSPSTTIPFSVDDLLKMHTLTNAISSPCEGPRKEAFGVQIDQGSSSTVARLMMLFAQERVNHFHGEYAARLDRRQSVYGWSPKRQYWMAILSLLLFNAPSGHLRDLQGIFMDQIVSQLSWKRLMEKVLSEWQDMTLYGSLILNANVGILAVPGSSNSSIAQIASYVSICFGLGSIILGLLLSRKYRPEAADAVTAGPALGFKQHCLGALEARAVLFSLPYVFMMWGMAAFLSSFLIVAVEISNVRTSAVVLATAAALSLAILSSILSAHGWSLARIIRTITEAFTRQPPSQSRRRRWNKKIDFRQFWRPKNDRNM
ncbi:hypothetical protein B0H13DRAFT_2269521, partial [Mycena leptocephala]